jgi:hypothetical protein
MILNALEQLLTQSRRKKSTDTVTYLHQIAENSVDDYLVYRYVSNWGRDKLLRALQHLKHNKHKVVLFHVVDAKTELNFDFDNTPRKFMM